MAHRKYAARAAGATLGYIAGGAKGAHMGYKVGSWAAKRGTKRKRGTLGGRTPYKRRRTWSKGGANNFSAVGKRGRRGTTNIGDDAGHSSFRNVKRTRNKFIKGYKKIAAPCFLNVATSQRVSSGLVLSGVQQVVDLFAYQGATAVQEVPTPGRLQLIDMLNILSATDPTPATTIGGANLTANTRKIMIKSMVTRYTMKNVTNIPIRIILYDCVSRRDGTLFTGPTAAWNQGITNEFVAIPGGANQNTLTSRFPGSTPFQSQQFCQLYKVRRVTKFELHPGSVHVHIVSTKPGGLMSAEYINNETFYKGLSTSVMAVITGGVVDDFGAGGTSSLVSTSAFALDVVAETRSSFTSMERSRSNYVQYNFLSTVVPLAQQFNTLEDTDATGIPTATS